jgi:hypothetical protein
VVVFFFGHYGGDQFISPLKVETIDRRKHFKKNKNCLEALYLPRIEMGQLGHMGRLGHFLGIT